MTINLDNYRTSINYYGDAIRNSIVEYFITFLERGGEITEEICEYTVTSNGHLFSGQVNRIKDDDAWKILFKLEGIHFRSYPNLHAIVFCWKDKYYYISY